jgi:hypothetical protein
MNSPEKVPVCKAIRLALRPEQRNNPRMVSSLISEKCRLPSSNSYLPVTGRGGNAERWRSNITTRYQRVVQAECIRTIVSTTGPETLADVEYATACWVVTPVPGMRAEPL